MKSKKIPTPISGDDLKILKLALSTKISPLLWLFGWSSNQWSSMTKKGPGELGGNHAIMIRLLTKHPELSPIPKTPNPQIVFDQIVDVDPTFSERQFPILLGMEPATKARLFDPDETNSYVTNHLLLIISNGLDRLNTVREKMEFIAMIKQTAEDEAASRGIEAKKLWVSGGWRQAVIKSKANED